MKEYSIVMGLFDFIPVILFFSRRKSDCGRSEGEDSKVSLVLFCGRNSPDVACGHLQGSL